MKIIGLGIGLMLVLCNLGFVPQALGVTGQTVLVEVQNRYENTNDLEARFLQEFVGKMMK